MNWEELIDGIIIGKFEGETVINERLFKAKLREAMESVIPCPHLESDGYDDNCSYNEALDDIKLYIDKFFKEE